MEEIRAITTGGMVNLLGRGRETPKQMTKQTESGTMNTNMTFTRKK
jgi:hypothetical protein